MGTQVTFEMIYYEVKQVNKEPCRKCTRVSYRKRASMVTVSEEEKEEVKRSIEKVKEGNRLTLEELKNA